MTESLLAGGTVDPGLMFLYRDVSLMLLMNQGVESTIDMGQRTAARISMMAELSRDDNSEIVRESL